MAQEKTFNASKSNFGFKGWVLIIYAFVFCFVNTSVGSSWQLMATAWESDLGWSSTTLLSWVSYGSLLSVVLGLVLSRVATKFSVRRMCIFCAVVLCAALFIFGYAPNVQIACLLEMIICGTDITLAYILNPMILTNWFPRKKGLVMGWATIGCPAGGGVAAIIVNYVQEHFGYQVSYMPFAVLALIFTVILVVMIRDYPEECGVNPDNDESMTREQANAMIQAQREAEKHSPWTLARCLKCPQLWIMALALGVSNMVGGTMGTLMLRITDLGHTTAWGANMILFSSLVSFPFSYLFGLLDSKKGPKVGMQWVYIVTIGAMVCLAQGSYIALILAMVFLGAAVGGGANFAASVTAEYWGQSNFSRVFGVVYPILQVIGSMASAFIVQTAALFGGYVGSYICLAAANAVALVAFTLALKDREFVKKLERSWN